MNSQWPDFKMSIVPDGIDLWYHATTQNNQRWTLIPIGYVMMDKQIEVFFYNWDIHKKCQKFQDFRFVTWQVTWPSYFLHILTQRLILISMDMSMGFLRWFLFFWPSRDQKIAIFITRDPLVKTFWKKKPPPKLRYVESNGSKIFKEFIRLVTVFVDTKMRFLALLEPIYTGKKIWPKFFFLGCS